MTSPRAVASIALVAAVALTSQLALAAPKVTVSPRAPRPGDAVLVTVAGAKAMPQGKVDGTELQFFRAKAGYQAVFAVPLDTKATNVDVKVDDAKPVQLDVRATTFPEARVVVEEEYATPPAAERARIDDDNAATLAAMTAKAKGDPRFTREFRRPGGAVTSAFGEWRTFNDGHRSQHLGTDFAAREGAPVRAINSGRVELVRDTFLGGTIVVVSHGAGIASAYFHLRATDVQEGDDVKAGATIGRAGQTGRATGPHIHLAVRVPGGLVNPATFMALKLAPAPTRK